MSSHASGGHVPRALIHKKILDRAAADAGASMQAIADEIPGASLDLVEQVLDEYGDPADGSDPQGDETGDAGPTAIDRPPRNAASGRAADPEPDAAGPPAEEPPSDERDAATGDGATADAPAVAVEDLSDGQLAVFEAVREDPGATQAELAAELDVSAATVCNRVNAVPGFEWRFRELFVERLFDPDGTPARGSPNEADGSTAEDDPAGSTGGDDPDGTEPVGDATGAVEGGAGTVDEGPGEAESAESNGGPSPDDRIDELAAGVETLAAEVATLRTRVTDLAERPDPADELTDGGSTGGREGLVVDDPELVRKLLHVALGSDRITEEEELTLIDGLFDQPSR